MSTDAPTALAPTRSPVVVVAVGVAIAAAAALVQPVVGVALALVALGAVVIARTPVARIGRPLVIAAAAAAILGPNLAAPPVPWLFGFRVIAVALGVGALGYLLLGGRIAVPAPIVRPVALLGGLLLWSAVSVTWAGDPVAALRWTGLLALGISLAVAIAVVCRTRRRALWLLIVLAGVFALACLVAAAELLTGFRLPTSRASGRIGLLGVTSLFGNENNFATYLTLTAPYLLVLPVVFRDVRLRALGIGGGVLALLFVLNTGSKSGLVSVGLILIGLLVLLGADRRRRGRLLAGVAVAALAVALVVPASRGGGLIPLPERTVTKLDFNLLSAQVEARTGSGGVRASLLEDGLGLVAQTGGLGVGAGNAEVEVRSLVNFPGVGNLHNWWLEILVNLGLVGLTLYVAFYAITLVGLVRVARAGEDPVVRYLALAGALAMIGWIAGSIGPSSAIAFAPMWVTFGLALATLSLGARR